MLYRKVIERLETFKKEKKALLITGARQVGKSYIIRSFGLKNYRSFAEINFLQNNTALEALKNIKDTDTFLLRLTALVSSPLEEGKTLIFFDEIQEIPDILTHIKFLVEDGRYRYILSGSLLGVELNSFRSYPVGYMDSYDMYPMDFEEFALANGVQPNLIQYLRDCYETRKPVDDSINNRFLQLFRLYLITGGMPEAVQKYIDTKNLREVQLTQSSIVTQYRMDIGKYDKDNRLYIAEVFDAIPAELNAKNKRFILKNLNENRRFYQFSNTFLWLKNAGVALPVNIAEEPDVPLELSKKTNLFKLFLNDVGLLASMYENDGIQLKILNNELDINNGSVYENAVAQELKAHGFRLYYFNSKKQGEVDFLIEKEGKVVPIEVKSGKDYKRHAALDNLLSNKSYNIPEAFVLAQTNIFTNNKTTYLPVYMIAFLKREKLPEDLIYQIDFSDIVPPISH